MLGQLLPRLFAGLIQFYQPLVCAGLRQAGVRADPPCIALPVAHLLPWQRALRLCPSMEYTAGILLLADIDACRWEEEEWGLECDLDLFQVRWGTTSLVCCRSAAACVQDWFAVLPA